MQRFSSPVLVSWVYLGQSFHHWEKVLVKPLFSPNGEKSFVQSQLGLNKRFLPIGTEQRFLPNLDWTKGFFPIGTERSQQRQHTLSQSLDRSISSTYSYSPLREQGTKNELTPFCLSGYNVPHLPLGRWGTLYPHLPCEFQVHCTRTYPGSGVGRVQYSLTSWARCGYNVHYLPRGR